MNEKSALVAMSGGVDSSVAALLMKNRGYDTHGVTLKLYVPDNINLNENNSCCSISEIEDARLVANNLGIPFYVIDFGDNFKKKVIDKFIESYMIGETPNPCVDCNRDIKFKEIHRFAKEKDINYVVTGHYARIEYDTVSQKFLLKKGLDHSKDQSYVLYNLTQEQLAHTLFPVGELSKDEVRKLALENNFANADKPDSQDICFVKDGDYLNFIENYSGHKCKPGNFLNLEGDILGRHKGVEGYTIGQRKGLGVSAETPLYVISKNVDNNTVVLGQDKMLYSKCLIAKDANFITVDKFTSSMKINARIRYKQVETPAFIHPEENGLIRVEFEKEQRAVTSGQAVVFYDGDVVVGGATIA